MSIGEVLELSTRTRNAIAMDHKTDGCGKTVCCKFNRRQALVGTGAAVAAVLGYPLVKKWCRARTPVFLAKNQRYDGPLVETIAAGLEAVGFDKAWVRGRKVLLKPNLVEPTLAAPQITTHPSVIRAAADVFLRWGAEVKVGEAPGHIRDTEMALVESGVGEAIRDDKLRFVDLNYSDFRETPNAGGLSTLRGFTFPTAVLDADLIVSMPKLKTHHWMGVTASMKNLYGTLPGQIYGWPKNVLHYAGIPQTVVDINASLPRSIGIVDGIVCMEGDGPILGTPKPMGVLAIGLNLPALDATLARMTGFDPWKVPYLALADERLGMIAERTIVQRGEPWRDLHSPFQFLDRPHLRQMRMANEDV
jgi:uncharacterized protein (DUF362 family)